MLVTPVTRLVPFTVKPALAVDPEAVNVAVPSVTWPTKNAMLPVGAVLPDAGVRVTDKVVDALEAMLAGLAARVRLVDTGPPVMVSVADPDELPKALVPTYAAVIVLALKARFVPGNARVAVDVPGAALTSAAEPSDVAPIVKLTVPVGVPEPDAGLTVATNWVVPLFAILAGLAVTVVLVSTAVEGRVTVTEVVDGAKVLTPR